MRKPKRHIGKRSQSETSIFHDHSFSIPANPICTNAPPDTTNAPQRAHSAKVTRYAMNEPTPFPLGVIQFSELPDDAKRRAAPDIAQGLQWGWYGRRVEPPDATELKRWLPDSMDVAICGNERSSSGNGFVGICGTDSACPAGNKSSGAMIRNADISRKLASVSHAKKRFIADCLIAAKPDLSNRELARMGSLSHTYIANRRKIAKGGNKSLSGGIAITNETE
jgi:hypothetical protein